MRVLRDPAELDSIPDVDLQRMLSQRFALLSQEEPYDPTVHGYFIVVEDGDSLDLLNKQLGFVITVNRFDGKRFGDEGFMGGWEILEEHASCFEFVFILSDDGFGVVVFVPKTGQVDAALLAMCRRFAVKAEEGA